MRSPNGTARLCQIAELNPRLEGELGDDELVSFVPMSAVDEVTAGTSSTLRPYHEVRKGYTPFLNGDVLVAKITPCFENGKIAQAGLTRRVGFGSTEFHVVRPMPDKADARYVLHFLRQERIRVEGERRMTGSAGQRRVPAYFLADLELPLPPLAEQRRIAEVLDQADALRAKRRTALAELDTLTQAIFVEMFGDPTTNPKGWPMAALGDVALTTSGGTPDRDIAEYYGGSVPWVKSGELHEGFVTATEEFLTELGVLKSSAKIMPSGTVLVAMYGATAGVVATLSIAAATNQAICCVQPKDKIEAVYLAHLMKRLTPSLLVKRVGGAQPNLSQKLLRALQVIVPPIHLQSRFSCRVAAVEKLKAAHRASLAELDVLFASLQDRAFRGEL